MTSIANDNTGKPTSGGGRPAIYKTSKGQRVPGVTTILGGVKESDALIAWAWRMGAEGKDYRKVRDDAADIGKMAHTWIDDNIHGRAPTAFPDATREQLEAADKALCAFIRWRQQTEVVFIETEVPLVSELLLYGGTTDGLVQIDGKFCVIDYKSSKKAYYDMVAQLAGYRNLYRECRGLDLDCGHIVRVNKDYGSFAAIELVGEQLDIGWDYFRNALAVYQSRKLLKEASGL